MKLIQNIDAILQKGNPIDTIRALCLYDAWDINNIPESCLLKLPLETKTTKTSIVKAIQEAKNRIARQVNHTVVCINQKLYSNREGKQRQSAIKQNVFFPLPKTSPVYNKLLSAFDQLDLCTLKEANKIELEYIKEIEIYRTAIQNGQDFFTILNHFSPISMAKVLVSFKNYAISIEPYLSAINSKVGDDFDKVCAAMVSFLSYERCIEPDFLEFISTHSFPHAALKELFNGSCLPEQLVKCKNMDIKDIPFFNRPLA